MAGWHHRLNGHEFEWTPGVGDGQGSLACCNSWGHKESDTTERLTELNWIFHYIYVYMYQLLYLFICWWTSRLFQCLPAATKSLHLCLTLCDPHRWQPIRLRHTWDSPGKNTGVGCHFLLQYKKVKIESEVVQLCPTLGDPMDCSLPGFSVHGIFQARVLEWGAIAFSVSMF